MKRFIPVISIGIILGVLVSFGEGVISSLNLYDFNAINFNFLVLILSILITLFLVLFSDNLITAILSVFLYAVFFLLFKVYARITLSYELYVRIGLTLFSGILSALLIFPGKYMIKKYKAKGMKFRRNIAFPVIFFLASILVSMAIVLFEQKDLYGFIPLYFYSYLYFLIFLSSLAAFLSVNEISGFLIGFCSIPIYFLMTRLIGNNFDFSMIFNLERVFLMIIAAYSIIFGLSTLLMGHSSAVLLKGFVFKKANSEIKENDNSKNTVKEKDNTFLRESGNKEEIVYEKQDKMEMSIKPVNKKEAKGNENQKDVDKN